MTEDQELELFAIRSKYFRDIPHPKLILKSINQVEKHLKNIPVLPIFPNPYENVPLQDVLRNYTNTILVLKSKLAQATDAESMYLALNEVYWLHWYLLLRASLYTSPELLKSADEIKQSEPFDTWAILRFIEQESITDNEIKGYICRELDRKPTDLSLLTRFCLQAQKIILNG